MPGSKIPTKINKEGLDKLVRPSYPGSELLEKNTADVTLDLERDLLKRVINNHQPL